MLSVQRGGHGVCRGGTACLQLPFVVIRGCGGPPGVQGGESRAVCRPGHEIFIAPLLLCLLIRFACHVCSPVILGLVSSPDGPGELCPAGSSPGLPALLGDCRAPGCSVKGFTQLGSSPVAAWAIQSPCVAVSGDTDVSPPSPSQSLVPQKSIVCFALSHTGAGVGFYPCSLPGGLCCIPVPFGMGRGTACRDGPHCTGLCVLGTGSGWGGVSLR